MARPPKTSLNLNMPFEEALERFVGVDAKEISARLKRVRRDKKKKAQMPPPKRPSKLAKKGQKPQKNLARKKR